MITKKVHTVESIQFLLDNVCGNLLNSYSRDYFEVKIQEDEKGKGNFFNFNSV